MFKKYARILDCKRNEEAENEMSRWTIFQTTDYPVSYTHLDVYKRQVYIMCWVIARGLVQELGVCCMY